MNKIITNDVIIDNAVAEIANLQQIITGLEDSVAVLRFQHDFMVKELRNCQKIFKHEGKEGYADFVSLVLKAVGEA